MSLSYEAVTTNFAEDNPPFDVRLQLSRSISGGTMGFTVDMNFSPDGDAQPDATYLGWMETVRDALVGAGWSVSSFGQTGEAHRDITHT